MVNEYHIMAMGWVSKPVLDQIAAYALRINELLTAYLKEVNIELIDFKLEFGKTADGTIVLADEIAQIVLILPPVGEEQLGVVCVQQERRRVVVHLLEGSGDAREMVFPPGVLVESIHSSDCNAEQKTSQQQA